MNNDTLRISSFHLIGFYNSDCIFKICSYLKKVFNIPIVIRVVDILVETLSFIFVSCYEKETLDRCLRVFEYSKTFHGLRFIKKERK